MKKTSINPFTLIIMKNNKMSTLLKNRKKAMLCSRSSIHTEVFFTGEGGTLRSDTNFLNEYSRVIDKAVKLIHKHSKYTVIKVHVNIK